MNNDENGHEERKQRSIDDTLGMVDDCSNLGYSTTENEYNIGESPIDMVLVTKFGFCIRIDKFVLNTYNSLANILCPCDAKLIIEFLSHLKCNY